MTAKDLKASILQLAIQGKLVAQDPRDEPASALLARVRGEGEVVRQETGDASGDQKTKRPHISRLASSASRVLRLKSRDLPPITDDEKPFDLPEGWAWVRLGEIGVTNIGLTYRPQDVSSNGTPVLRSNNIQNGILVLDELVRVNIGVPDRALAHTNDILICARNGSKTLVGKSAIVNAEGMAFGAFMTILRTPYYRYAHVFLCSELFRAQLSDSNTTTINQITQDKLKNIVIPLPPLAEQKRIVAKIEELMPMVERYGAVKEKSDALEAALPDAFRKSVLQYAIQGKLVPQDPNDEPASALLERIYKSRVEVEKGRKGKAKLPPAPQPIPEDEQPFDLPEGWAWCRLGDVGVWGSGATPAKGNSAYHNKGTIPWLLTGDLNDSVVVDIPNKITIRALDETSVRLNPVGSVLIAMYGATIGKVGILGIEATTNQACCACVPYDCIFNRYLFYYLMSQRDAFRKRGEGGAQPNISKEKIIATPIPLPPLGEQKRIVAEVERLLALGERLKVAS